eukprot:s2575_g4.t1
MALLTRSLLLLVLTRVGVEGRVKWKRNPLSQIPKPYIESFTQKLDHNNFVDQRTFSQRYFVHNASFREGGPLFFYTGNEGPLESFYYNTGLPFDWADEFGALIVFGEHRYYGETLPFGNASFDKDKLGYLSISQVLADYALLVTHLNASYRFKGVVAMGGSYGGMLSAWARIKYPNVFDMALAASAPIPQAVNLIDDKATFYKLVTADASKADPKCPDAVRSAFASIVQKASTAEGLKEISDTFQLCKTMNASELDHFLQYTRNAWTEMAMCNYPYPSSFLAPLPAWPVAAACGKVVGASTPMQGLADAVAMLYRQPNMTCFDMYSIFVECADQTGCGTGKAATAWDYQMCTEIFYEQNTNNVSDMFPPRRFRAALIPKPYTTFKLFCFYLLYRQILVPCCRKTIMDLQSRATMPLRTAAALGLEPPSRIVNRLRDRTLRRDRRAMSQADWPGKTLRKRPLRRGRRETCFHRWAELVEGMEPLESFGRTRGEPVMAEFPKHTV